MSQVTEQSVRFQTALASIKLIQASAVLDLTEDDFDFLTSNKVWIVINIIGSREGSRNRRRLKANQTGKKFRVGIKSNISTNRNNLISGVDRCIHLNAMKKTTITSINRQTIKI